MRRKSLFTIICLLLCNFVFLSCNNLISETAGQTSLSVMLPYGTGRAAEGKSYKFIITFSHESGEKDVLEGESGNVISLSPAKAGEYSVYGEA